MAKRQQLWCEAAQTATLLDNILVQDSAKSSPFTQFFRIDAVYAKHIKEFGEMCVVAGTDNKVGRTKIDPRGKINLFVGYSTQHAGDVYRLLDPKTSRVIHSRDVKWIGKIVLGWSSTFTLFGGDIASSSSSSSSVVSEASPRGLRNFGVDFRIFQALKFSHLSGSCTLSK